MSDPTPTKVRHIHWIDQVVANPKQVSHFYTEVLGLEAEAVPEDDTHTSYAMKVPGGEEVLGICDAAVFPNWVQGWVPYLDVPDYDRSVSRITAAGGTIVQQMQQDYNWPGQRFCLVRDPSGAAVMICEAKRPM